MEVEVHASGFATVNKLKLERFISQTGWNRANQASLCNNLLHRDALFIFYKNHLDCLWIHGDYFNHSCSEGCLFEYVS